MRISVLIIALAQASISASAANNICQAIESDHIYASDLAKAAPVFATLAPSIEIGLSPLPGVVRVFRPVDLLRLARDNGLTISGLPAEVCFERTGGSARAASAKPLAPPPLAVRRGEKVAVVVISGGVTLQFESEAESGGRAGDTVIVRNPENGSRFAARIEDQGKVVVNK